MHSSTGQQNGMWQASYGAGLCYFFGISVYFSVFYFILLFTFVVNKCYIGIGLMPSWMGGITRVYCIRITV